MIAASWGSSRPGFVRIESGIPIFPMSWKSAAVERRCFAAESGARARSRARRGGRAANDRPCTGRGPRPRRSASRSSRAASLRARGTTRRGRAGAPRVLVLRAHAHGRTADEDCQDEPEDTEDDADRVPDRPACVGDDRGHDRVVERDLGCADGSAAAVVSGAHTFTFPPSPSDRAPSRSAATRAGSPVSGPGSSGHGRCDRAACGEDQSTGRGYVEAADVVRQPERVREAPALRGVTVTRSPRTTAGATAASTRTRSRLGLCPSGQQHGDRSRASTRGRRRRPRGSPRTR